MAFRVLDKPEAERYGRYVENDPFRALHYATVLEALGLELQQNKTGDRYILDVGCGEGYFARKLANFPNIKVTGFDISEDLINLARQTPYVNRDKVEYVHTGAEKFNNAQRFNDAVSVMVLPYACDASNLSEFFEAAYKHLEPGGRFISVIFNPEFKAFNRIIGTRNFTKMEDDNVQVEFRAPPFQSAFNQQQPTILKQFSKEKYEEAAVNAGFKKENIEWKNITPNEEALNKQPSGFWENFIKTPPYKLIIATKPL